MPYGRSQLPTAEVASVFKLTLLALKPQIGWLVLTSALLTVLFTRTAFNSDASTLVRVCAALLAVLFTAQAIRAAYTWTTIQSTLTSLIKKESPRP